MGMEKGCKFDVADRHLVPMWNAQKKFLRGDMI